MAISLAKAINPVRINSRSSSRSKTTGTQFKLISVKGIPTVEYSLQVSGVYYAYNVASLDGLKLVMNENNLRLLAKKHEVNLSESKIQTFVNSLVNKETLASLSQDGLLQLDRAIEDYAKALITTADIDLTDTSLEDCVLQLMLQTSRQAVFAGSNSAMNKMLSKLTPEDEERLRSKVNAYIKANPRLLPSTKVSDRALPESTTEPNRFEAMNKKQLQQLLIECEIPFKTKDTKPTLLELLNTPFSIPVETSEVVEEPTKELVNA